MRAWSAASRWPICVCARRRSRASVPQDQVPLAIDEFPVLFVAAACAEGETVLTGPEELRVKESDRIQVMADGLAGAGRRCASDAGRDRDPGWRGHRGGGRVDSHGDHRIAMAFTMAAHCAPTATSIDDCANVNTSFPVCRTGLRWAGCVVALHYD